MHEWAVVTVDMDGEDDLVPLLGGEQGRDTRDDVLLLIRNSFERHLDQMNFLFKNSPRDIYFLERSRILSSLALQSNRQRYLASYMRDHDQLQI